ncbi:MAG: hypothetical protein GXO49_06475 [Chlorobi bacterium]|nr:hypothetical protein [Chlorobiota bacterium]
MNIETRKISFIQEFLNLQNEEIISKFESLLKKLKSDSLSNKLKPMSLKQLNNEIDIALEDSENDNVIEANELRMKYQ